MRLTETLFLVAGCIGLLQFFGFMSMWLAVLRIAEGTAKTNELLQKIAEK